MEKMQLKEELKKGTTTEVPKEAVVYVDWIGPEIMQATLRVLGATGANTLAERIEIGAQVYLSGNFLGIEKSAWQTI